MCVCRALFVIPAVVFGDTLFICETDCLRCGNRSSKHKKGPEDGVSERGIKGVRSTWSSSYPCAFNVSSVLDLVQLWTFFLFNRRLQEEDLSV